MASVISIFLMLVGAVMIAGIVIGVLLLLKKFLMNNDKKNDNHS